MTNKKNIIIAAVAGLLCALIVLALIETHIIPLECTVQYLNPWQLFAECHFQRLPMYILTFIGGFFVSFFMLKKRK